MAAFPSRRTLQSRFIAILYCCPGTDLRTDLLRSFRAKTRTRLRIWSIHLLYSRMTGRWELVWAQRLPRKSWPNEQSKIPAAVVFAGELLR